jgi:hypothetical protein
MSLPNFHKPGLQLRTFIHEKPCYDDPLEVEARP